jgi:competence protein ComEC
MSAAINLSQQEYTVIKHTKIQSDLRGFILIVVAVASMSGILLDSWLLLPQYVLLIGAAIALACVILSWHDNRWRLVSLVILWLLLGAWRFAIASPVGDPQSINAFIGASKLEVQGTIADDPKILDRSRLLLVAVNAISINNGSSWQDAHGQIEVQMLGAPLDNPYGPNYGDSVEMQGKVQPPFPHHSPEVLASLTFPRLNVVGSAGNPIIAAFFHLRLSLASIIEQSLPQPMAALLIAILLSLQTPTLKPLAKLFQLTGTAHLIAPSGFKVTILAGIVAGSTSWIYKRRARQLKPLLPAQKHAGYWRRWSVTSLVILSIIGYSVLSGAGPAAQRACIMGIILVVAPRFGRVYNIHTAMALAILIMSIFDPFVLWNTGFQLSTIGTLGIVVLTPLFQRLFRPIEHLPFAIPITETVAVTLAAQIATLPIFAITFNQVSLIAPLTNLLTVPLLGMLILLGVVLCVTGFIALPLGMLCGLIIFPLLKYTMLVVSWCASIPWAFLTVSNLDTRLAWVYYGVLILILSIILRKWPDKSQMHEVNIASSPLPHNIQINNVMMENKPSETQGVPALLSPRILPILRYAAVMIVILAIGSTIAAAPANGQLSIILLNVGPAGKPSQGEAILIHTIDGKTILIDGGLDATSLAQELDGRLPFWQRSIDTVILTSPRQDHLIGAQDVISRFQVGQVLDAGMLHPGAGYALWKRTIIDRNLPYSQVREGSSIQMGTQASLQVLWPPTVLHKGTNEELDNALILRLVAPHFNMLLLGSAALSKYALSGLLTTIDTGYLKANIVQVVGEAGKAFPTELTNILQLASPSVLLITPSALSSKLSKAKTTSTILPAQFVVEPWQVIQTAQAGSTTISSSTSGWNVNTE